jgi:hypothetical protein
VAVRKLLAQAQSQGQGEKMSKKAMKLALEALEAAISDDKPYIVLSKEAITALREALAEQPAQRKPLTDEPSPTAGMNITQRILHVGGRNNTAWYVEFGSIQAVEALVRQVLRDLPKHKPLPAHEIVTLYEENPRSDSDMIDFARAIEAAHGIKGDA